MSYKDKKRKAMLWLGLLVITSAILMSACSKSDDKNIKSIKTVLEHELSGPDEKLMDLMWNPEYRTVVNNKEENKELDKYLQEKYGPYFTDSGLNSFIAAFGGTQYQTFAHNSGYKLDIKSVATHQNKNNPNLYTFKAKVGYQKGEGKEKTVYVQGEVTFSEKEKGEIVKFQYDDDDGLLENLKNQQNSDS